MATTEVSRLIAEAPTMLLDCDIASGANRERDKIHQIGLALREAGFIRLDHQANALGLPRSTTWKLLRAKYRASGPNAKLIARMMMYKYLPPSVLSVLREYVFEKTKGCYGHDNLSRRRFVEHFSGMPELSKLEA